MCVFVCQGVFREVSHVGALRIVCQVGSHHTEIVTLISGIGSNGGKCVGNT